MVWKALCHPVGARLQTTQEGNNGNSSVAVCSLSLRMAVVVHGAPIGCKTAELCVT